MFNLTPTTELEALKELDLMDSNASMGLSQLKHYAGQSFNSFWYGTTSPVLKVQMLGNKALEIFTDLELIFLLYNHLILLFCFSSIL